MVLEGVEIFQITKAFLFSNSFVPVFSSTCVQNHLFH